MAIGIGLAYVLLLETLIFGLLGSLGDTVKAIHVWFPVANAGYLSEAFGKVAAVGNGAGSITGTPDADATHAVVVLALWIIGLAAISGCLCAGETLCDAALRASPAACGRPGRSTLRQS